MSPPQQPDLLTEQMSGRDTQMCLDQYQLLLCGGCSHRHRYSKGFAAAVRAEAARCCGSLLGKAALEIILLGVRGKSHTAEHGQCISQFWHTCGGTSHPTSSHRADTALSAPGLILPSPSASPKTLLVSRGVRKV